MRMTDGTVPFMTAAPDGALFLWGQFSGSLDVDPGPAEDLRTAVDHDFFLIKLASDATLAWARTWPGIGGGVSVGLDGSVVATGHFGETVDFDAGPGVTSATAIGPQEAFVFKLDASGSLAWVRTFSIHTREWIEGSVEGGRTVVAPDGTIYATGHFRGQVDLDPGPGLDLRGKTNDALAFDAYLVKLSGAGTVIWAKTFAGSGDDSLGPIAIAPSGLLWAGGSFGGSLDCDPGPAVERLQAVSRTDALVVQLDSSGNQQGCRAFVEAGPSGVASIAFESDGSAYVAVNVEGPDVVPPYGSTTVHKLAVSGSALWVRRGLALAGGAAPVPGGGLLLAGQGQPAFAGGVVVLLTKLGADGRIVWTVPAPRNPSYYSMSVATFGNQIFVPGWAAATGTDLDPESGIDAVGERALTLTRYRF